MHQIDGRLPAGRASSAAGIAVGLKEEESPASTARLLVARRRLLCLCRGCRRHTGRHEHCRI